MALDVNQLDAGRVLRDSYERVSNEAMTTCPIAKTVDLTLAGKGCLTYQYILLTALVAKLTNPEIDMLSLQVDDSSQGAYAPRTLCKEVIYPFQKQILSNALNGNNDDPLVNKPARYLRLAKSNAARGDGRAVLNQLCDSLPALNTPKDVQDTLDYLMTKLLQIAKEKKERADAVSTSVKDANYKILYKFLSDLLDQGFGGAALVLVTYALFLIQSGSASRQRSDLDIEKNGSPFLGVELKDKPFTANDVARAADTALSSGLTSLLFVSGRHSGLPSVATYFSEVRKEYANKGFAVGVIEVARVDGFSLSYTSRRHRCLQSVGCCL